MGKSILIGVAQKMKADRSRYEKVLADCAFRANLWKEFLKKYQEALEQSSDAFSKLCADFRERFLRGSSN